MSKYLSDPSAKKVLTGIFEHNDLRDPESVLGPDVFPVVIAAVQQTHEKAYKLGYDDGSTDEKENTNTRLRDKDSEIEELTYMVRELEDNKIPNQDDNAGQKREVLADLAANCTVEELEALEYIMRMKKGSDYRGRLNMPHEDNVDTDLLLSKHFVMGFAKTDMAFGAPRRLPERPAEYWQEMERRNADPYNDERKNL